MPPKKPLRATAAATTRLRWGLAFLLLAALAPSSLEAKAAEIAELAGTTTVEGDAPSSTLVRVPAPTTISVSVEGNEDISVSGSGRYIGVGLVSEETEDRIGPTLIAGRIEPSAICDASGCPYGVATPFAWVDLNFYSDTETVTIPPGLYRLHLVLEPDEGPASVTLRFAGLDGEAHIAPAEPSGLKTMPLPPRVPTPASQSVYWSGGTEDIGASTRGIMWSMAWLRHPLEPAGEYHYCAYVGREPEDAPGCPTADIDVGINHSLVGYPVKAWILLEGYGFPVQAMFGQKTWFAGDLTDGVDGVALWLPFGDVTGTLPSMSGLLKATVFPVPAVAGDELNVPQTSRAAQCMPAPCPVAVKSV